MKIKENNKSFNSEYSSSFISSSTYFLLSFLTSYFFYLHFSYFIFLLLHHHYFLYLDLTSTYQLGHNQFSHLTLEEFAELNLFELSSNKNLEKNNNKNNNEIKHKNIGASPASWDWTTLGAVTSVKDQGKCRCFFHFNIYFFIFRCFYSLTLHFYLVLVVGHFLLLVQSKEHILSFLVKIQQLVYHHNN